MTAGCTLHSPADATRNSVAAERNSHATSPTDRRADSAMTGSELRAQLRMQHQGNLPVAGDATSPNRDATLCNGVPSASDAQIRRWRVCYPSVGPMEVLFTPPATQHEASAIYPGARIEAQPESVRRIATPSEAAELRALIAAVRADATEPELAEALAIAVADPDAALLSFRALAASSNSSGRNAGPI